MNIRQIKNSKTTVRPFTIVRFFEQKLKNAAGFVKKNFTIEPKF